MKLRSLLILATLGSMLLFQNCRKEKENIIPVVTQEPEDHDKEHWNYEHPDTWGGISGDCDGVIQSPINISTQSTLKANLPELKFYYTDFPIAIIDNGHTIQVNTHDNYIGNHVTFNDKQYKLRQFHFHAKSEHTINGEHTPMEMHMVHASDAGEILVIGLMIEMGDSANALVGKVWDNFPSERKFEEFKSTVINMNQVIPAGTGYYNYIGSLTTPPCHMGLQWIVMKDPLILSPEQVYAFRAKYDHNFRPTQNLNNRVVFEKI